MNLFNLTVIIPVRNGEQTLERCLSSIRAQNNSDKIEIIIADSMSEDASREIALRFGAKIIDVDVSKFDHGLTRNLAVEYATADLNYFTVQDAWIPENDMLEKMALHFSDAAVMGVVGHQATPHEKSMNPYAWFRPVSLPEVVRKVITKEKFDNLSVAEQKDLIAWDNVVAMYRKSALQQLPFEKTAFAEDWMWSSKALKKGWTLIRDPSLIVYHYHHQTFKYLFRTRYTINFHFFKYFGFLPELPKFFRPLISIFYQILKSSDITFKEKIYWLLHNISGLLAEFLSVADFLIRYKFFGEKGIEKGYRIYCKSIPQGKQKKINI